jgi:sugar transferase (PEP-CTERM/EpsH1 system associated)
MRILCLTSRLPYPPNRGDRLRAYNFLRQLAPHHELDLLSFIASADEREHITALEELLRSVEVVHHSPIRSAATVMLNVYRSDPLQVLYYRSRAMAQVVRRKLAENCYDAAYIHLFRMAPYLVPFPNLYRIVDLTDAISIEIRRSMQYRAPVSRLLYAIERPRIERYERWVCQTFEETWLISDVDRQALSPPCPGDRVRVVPNGVDLDRFCPGDQEVDRSLILFVGHMGVLHNIDAASYLVREILPLVRERAPACRLEIVGADPSPEVLKLAEDPAVQVSGFVPDLNAALNQAAVFVAPLRFAAGIQNKVLEAMAAGRPVVTTSLVNESLGAQPGREVMIGDTAAEIAGHVVTLLANRRLAEQIGRAARQFVGRTASWDHVVGRMETIERQLARDRR